MHFRTELQLLNNSDYCNNNRIIVVGFSQFELLQ